MNANILLALGLSLAACRHKDDARDDSAALPDGQAMAVVATVSSDYAVGALATVSLEDWSVSDSLSPVSSDPAVLVSEGHVIQLNRSTEDSARIYEPGAFHEPLLEFSLGDGANPHDAEVCGDALFVSLYGEDWLGVYDPETGNLLGKVDLSAWDDGDGLPEAATMVLRGETLYVALEQLDEGSAHWTPAGGVVVAVDCARRVVTDAWEVGPAPSISPDPDDETRLLVRTGVYFDADGALTWDGGLWRLDPASGALDAVGPAEDELEVNFTALAAAPGGKALVLGTDSDWLYSVYCLDLETGALDLLETVETYLPALAVNERGEAWVAARASWAAPEAVGGLYVYDVASCASKTGDTPIRLGLEPYAVAFY